MLVFLNFRCVLFGQTKADTLTFGTDTLIHPAKTKFEDAIDRKKRMFYILFEHSTEKIKSYKTEFILDKIDHDSDYNYLFIAEYWIAFHYKEIIPQLIQRLTNKKEVGLINSFDLIIQERISNGQMKFYGHGELSYDDLFTVAGRANRLLSEITGEDFGHVSMYSTQEELIALQQKWLEWINTEYYKNHP